MPSYNTARYCYQSIKVQSILVTVSWNVFCILGRFPLNCTWEAGSVLWMLRHFFTLPLHIVMLEGCGFKQHTLTPDNTYLHCYITVFSCILPVFFPILTFFLQSSSWSYMTNIGFVKTKERLIHSFIGSQVFGLGSMPLSLATINTLVK